MKNYLLYANECQIYPGAYMPMFKEEQVKEELKRTHKGDSLLPPVNVTEMGNSFKIEVAIPGVQREDFLVHADNNILSVCVLHKEYELQETENFQLHEFNYECFERHIILPENADAEFISAEYKTGILRLHVPIANRPVKNLHTRIVVY